MLAVIDKSVCNSGNYFAGLKHCVLFCFNELVHVLLLLYKSHEWHRAKWTNSGMCPSVLWLCMSAEIHAPLLSLLLFCHSVSLASNYNGTSKWECVFLCCCPFSCVQLLHPHAVIEIYKMIQ